jgi:uncharacterized Tic20 family protein
VTDMTPDDQSGRPVPPPGQPVPPPPPGGPEAQTPPPPYGAPGAPPPAAPAAWGQGATSTTDADARQWAMFAHLSALAALIIGGLTFLGPLIIYLVKKDDHPFIADQSREALNFNISVFIYALISTVLILIVVGILLLIAVAIAWVTLTIIASVRANSGEAYRYPLTIRLVS